MVRLNCLRVNPYTVHQTHYYNTAGFRLDHLQRILLTVYMQKDKSCHYYTLGTFLFSLFIVYCQTKFYHLPNGVVDCSFNRFFFVFFSYKYLRFPHKNDVQIVFTQVVCRGVHVLLCLFGCCGVQHCVLLSVFTFLFPCCLFRYGFRCTVLPAVACRGIVSYLWCTVESYDYMSNMVSVL